MDLDALKLLETVKDGDFNRSHKTCSEIDSKARIISLAHAAFLATIIGYGFKSFSDNQPMQQLFMVALLPPLFMSTWLFSRSLISKEYVEGMRVGSYENLINLEKYYKARIDFLNDAVRQNCTANTKKSKALGDAITMLLASFLIALISSGVAFFLNDLPPKSTRICLLIGTLIASAILTFFAAHFLIPSHKESSSKEDITNKQT